MTTNHFRVTAYHPTEDVTILIDSYGVYEKLWQLSSMLVMKGFNILEASDSTKFVNINIPDIAPNTDKLYLRACMEGKPDVFIHPDSGGNRRRVIQVENRMYIPNNDESL